MSASEDQIAVYQPNGTVRLDVRLENEMVWLAQEQISQHFGRDQSVVARHIGNILKEGELNRDSVYAKNAYVASDGKISVGYRVKSVQGARFRQWATGAPKEYLIHGYAVNTMFAQLEDKMDRRLAKHDDRLATLEHKVGFFVQAKEPPLRSTFCQNQPWNAGRLAFAAAKMGEEVIPGLLESIRKAMTKTRDCLRCHIDTLNVRRGECVITNCDKFERLSFKRVSDVKEAA